MPEADAVDDADRVGGWALEETNASKIRELGDVFRRRSAGLRHRLVRLRRRSRRLGTPVQNARFGLGLGRLEITHRSMIRRA
jgi:hypothetical protein